MIIVNNFFLRCWMKLQNLAQSLKLQTKNLWDEIVSFLKFLAFRAKNDTILRVSSSLSYTSLIALVPLLSIALAIFSAFSVFSDIRGQIQEFLIQNFVPSAEQEISAYLNEFINATGKLTTIGVVGLALTAILLLSTIENSFNFIFKVRQPRRIATKITLYWTVITLGPLLLGAAFSLRGYIYALNLLPDADTPSALSKLIPAGITFVILIMIYTLVPNRKVKIAHAAFGAVIALLLFWILRSLFGLAVISSGTYKTLYGAMAALPIFLVWMYLAWSVVIFGAVVTAAWGEYRQERLEKSNKAETKK